MKLKIFNNLVFATSFQQTDREHIFAVPHCKMCKHFVKKVNQYKFRCNALDHLMDNEYMQRGNCPSYELKYSIKLL